MKESVFICYSHFDADALNMLQKHLKPYERNFSFKIWADKKIKVGTAWKTIIEKELEECTVAVLIFSADLMASAFINDVEVPKLFNRMNSEGLKIIPVIYKPCAYQHMPEFSQIQSIPTPDKPIALLSKNKQEEKWRDIAKLVSDYVRDNQETKTVETPITTDDGEKGLFDYICELEESTTEVNAISAIIINSLKGLTSVIDESAPQIAIASKSTNSQASRIVANKLGNRIQAINSDIEPKVDSFVTGLSVVKTSQLAAAKILVEKFGRNLDGSENYLSLVGILKNELRLTIDELKNMKAAVTSGTGFEKQLTSALNKFNSIFYRFEKSILDYIRVLEEIEDTFIE